LLPTSQPQAEVGKKRCALTCQWTVFGQETDGCKGNRESRLMLLLSGVILSYHSGKINLNNESSLFATAR